MIVAPFVVLDQSALESDDLLREALMRAGEHGKLLLPDIAIVEMTRVESWNRWFAITLSRIARFPHRIVVSRGTGELWREELRAGCPLTDLVSQDATLGVQSLLRDVAVGKGRSFDDALAAIPKMREPARRQHLDHGKNVDDVKWVIDNVLKPLLSDAQLARLRKGDRELVRTVLSNENLTDPFRSVFEGSAIPEVAALRAGVALTSEAVTRLVSGPSVISTSFMCRAAIGLKWLAQGGFDQVKPQKITNDLADAEYVLPAVYGAGLITAESRLSELYEDIRAAWRTRGERRSRLEALSSHD